MTVQKETAHNVGGISLASSLHLAPSRARTGKLRGSSDISVTIRGACVGVWVWAAAPGSTPDIAASEWRWAAGDYGERPVAHSPVFTWDVN